MNGGATTNLYFLLDFWLRLKGPYVQIKNSFISLNISFLKYSSFLYVNFIHFLIFTCYKHIISLIRLNFYVYLPFTRARSKFVNNCATIWSLPPFVYLLFQKNAPKSSFHNLCHCDVTIYCDATVAPLATAQRDDAICGSSQKNVIFQEISPSEPPNIV